MQYQTKQMIGTDKKRKDNNVLSGKIRQALKNRKPIAMT